jgi:toxin ParE1/3/4
VHKRKPQEKTASEESAEPLEYHLSARADADLHRIRDYFADQPAVRSKILGLIHDCARMLVEWPEMGRKHDEIDNGLRSFAAGSYVIFYRVIAGQVVLSRVLHHRRNLAEELSPHPTRLAPRQ